MRDLDQVVPKNSSAPTLSGSDIHTSSGGFDLPELWGVSSPGDSRSSFAATSTLSPRDLPFSP